MEIKVNIIYNFLNITFHLIFIGVSILYAIALTYLYTPLKSERERININFVNITLLKAYIVSVIWIIAVYFFR